MGRNIPTSIVEMMLELHHFIAKYCFFLSFFFFFFSFVFPTHEVIGYGHVITRNMNTLAGQRIYRYGQ